jgi:alkanesulfonate monooxygenase SsuD/methylene tetrahydromethanopterin reductase-like flavin-dependent oxidoreductase (luciferase family)
MLDCYVADSKAKAIAEYEPYLLYFFNTLLTYGQVYADKIQKGYFSQRAFDKFREGKKGTLADDTTVFTEWTSETVRHMLEFWPVGTADECAEKIIAECDEAGAQSVLLVINRGGMPQEMYLNQIRRIGAEVLPRLKKHQVTSVRFAEGAIAS